MNTSSPLGRASRALTCFALLLVSASIASGKPNILLIVADDYGAPDSRLYAPAGYDTTLIPPTPNIEYLAGKGVVFENAWAQPACSPTRATIITGKYAARSGVGWVVGSSTPPGELDVDDDTLLPKRLSQRGYSTALIGKWHLTSGETANGDPNAAGYDYFAGFTAGAIGTFPPTPGNGYFNWQQVIQGAQATQTNFATTENVNQAIGFIEQQEGPWFVSLNFAAPHFPYDLPPEELVDPAVVADVVDQFGSYTPGLQAGGGATLRQRRAAFNALVSAMDTEIGRLLEYVDLKDTCVIFCGDNGTQGGTQGGLAQFNVIVDPIDPNRAKGTLYEAGVRVPMVIAGAGVKRHGRRSKSVVNTSDIYMTLLNCAGDRKWARYDSISMLPAANWGFGLRWYAITEQYYPELPINMGAFGVVYEGFAIRNYRYKLIVQSDFDGALPMELYDLKRDPAELNNLFETFYGGLIGSWLEGVADYILNDE